MVDNKPQTMRSDIQTIGMGEQLEGIRIRDGQRWHICGGQRIQNAIDDM